MYSNTSRSFLLNQMRPKKRHNFITVFILGGIIFIFLLAYIAYGREESPGSSLIQIQVLFRHGERTPTYIYPTDPHKNYNWSDGLGSLTNEGKLNMFILGETFKKRYGHFLGELFFTKDNYILSSYSPRCQMSAMTFFAGLFPPVGSQLWNSELLWQPILVNFLPRNVDNLIAAKAPCKAFDKEKSLSDDDLSSHFTEKERDLFKYLSEHTGAFMDIEKVEFLYNTLKIEEHAGLQLPDWAKSVYPEPMKTIAAMNLASYSRTPKLKRLQGGPLLKQWINEMKTGRQKAYFYSGHDITLVNFMRTIGLAGEDFLPDYGATLIFELHLIEHEKMIKVMYYNSTKSTEPVNLMLPYCLQDYCPLPTFEENLKTYIPEDWSKECNFVV